MGAAHVNTRYRPQTETKNEDPANSSFYNLIPFIFTLA